MPSSQRPPAVSPSLHLSLFRLSYFIIGTRFSLSLLPSFLPSLSLSYLPLMRLIIPFVLRTGSYPSDHSSYSTAYSERLVFVFAPKYRRANSAKHCRSYNVPSILFLAFFNVFFLHFFLQCAHRGRPHVPFHEIISRSILRWFFLCLLMLLRPSECLVKWHDLWAWPTVVTLLTRSIGGRICS